MKRKMSRTLLAGAGAVAVAAAVFGISLGRALGSPLSIQQTPVEPAIDPASGLASEIESPPPNGGLSSEVIAMAVERAPFDSDRRPSRAYRMPDERVEAPVRAIPELPEPPEFELLGAVSAPDGGFVVMRVDGGDPQILRAGDRVEGYEIASVEPDHAVIAGLGRSWQVALASESPTVRRPSEDNDRRRRRSNSNDDDVRFEIPAEALRSVQEALARRSAQGGGQLPIRFGDDGSISITAPAQGNGPVIVRQNIRGPR